MNRDNNIKQSTMVMSAAIAALVVVAGYFLFKSSPPSQSPATATVTDHHGGLSMAANSETLNALVGQTLPDIRLSDKDGKIFTTADLKGKYTVLFFNEGLMCYPACWNQIAAFGSDPRFNSDQVRAISVVIDSSSDWQRAIGQMPQLAKATTMFDLNADASRRLGMLTTASSMHRGSFPGHTYVVLDKEATVRYVFDDPNMAIANEALFGKIEELK